MTTNKIISPTIKAIASPASKASTKPTNKDRMMEKMRAMVEVL